jgi:hypothetical protein
MPAEDSRATVAEVFDDGQLLLSSGSGGDVHKGDRIHVYRLGDKPVYVGEAKVTAVGLNHLLARMERPVPSQTPKAGDSAAKSVIPASDQGPERKLRGGAIFDKRPPG